MPSQNIFEKLLAGMKSFIRVIKTRLALPKMSIGSNIFKDGYIQKVLPFRLIVFFLMYSKIINAFEEQIRIQCMCSVKGINSYSIAKLRHIGE